MGVRGSGVWLAQSILFDAYSGGVIAGFSSKLWLCGQCSTPDVKVLKAWHSTYWLQTLGFRAFESGSKLSVKKPWSDSPKTVGSI